MLQKNLLNCFEAQFKIGGKTVLLQKNLTNSSIAGTAQNSLIKNGIGNATYASIDFDKELNVELQSNVIDLNQIALSCGSAIIEGAVTSYTMGEAYTLGGDKKITLPETPSEVGALEIIDIATDKVLKTTTDYTITSSSVTFTGTHPKGVYVAPYAYMSVEGTKRITISSNQFPEAGELILTTYMVDENFKRTDRVVIYIPKCKPSADWTISSGSDISSGNDNTLSLKALDDNGRFGTIDLIPLA